MLVIERTTIVFQVHIGMYEMGVPNYRHPVAMQIQSVLFMHEKS